VLPDADVGEQKQRAVFKERRASPEPFAGRAEIHPPERERTQKDMRSASLGWETGPSRSSGAPTSFETLDSGSGFWVAVAPLVDCVLILRGYGVGRPDVALVRADRLDQIRTRDSARDRSGNSEVGVMSMSEGSGPPGVTLAAAVHDSKGLVGESRALGNGKLI
jgi:hypothetical protein